MSNDLIINYFEAEAAIVQKLAEAVPEATKVFTPFGIADMVESSQPSICLHVIYFGDKVTTQEVGQGSKNLVNQQWLVVLAVRSPNAQLQDTQVIRETSGLIIPKILEALQGWQPVTWMRPLVRSSSPVAAGYSAAFAYFPFMFEGRIII